VVFWFEGADLKGLCSGEVEGGEWFNGLVEGGVIVVVVVVLVVVGRVSRVVFGVVEMIN